MNCQETKRLLRSKATDPEFTVNRGEIVQHINACEDCQDEFIRQLRLARNKLTVLNSVEAVYKRGYRPNVAS
jgi:hypothetical protein